jgi:hypothetical protein
LQAFYDAGTEDLDRRRVQRHSGGDNDQPDTRGATQMAGRTHCSELAARD